jgi:hypothetical protein
MKTMNKYTFEELVNDSGVNVTDQNLIKLLQPIANKLLLLGKPSERISEYGYKEMSLMLSLNLYKSQINLIKPYNNNVTWVNSQNKNIYTLIYDRPQYIGKKGVVTIFKTFI